MLDPSRWSIYAADPGLFRADLIVDCDGTAAKLGDVLDPWQDADFRALDGGWLRCVGRASKDNAEAPLRAYLERPRGHSKTSDLAVMTTWALLFARREVRGVAAAADKDQARLLRDAILRLVRLNPWIAEILEVQVNVVRNTANGHPGCGSELAIISSDADSSYGLLVDFVVADEPTNWQGDGELWHSLFSTIAKRATSMLVLISNAGRNKHACWQWTLREHARTGSGWFFHSLDGPQASWISAATLDEQRRILPPSVFKRLWLNVWSTGGDALEGEKIVKSVVLTGPMAGDEEGFRFVAGLDLSTRRDRSALVVLAAKPESHRVQLAWCQAWGAGPSGSVDLQAVQDAVFSAHKRFRRLKTYYDPYQAELMAQQLTQAGVKMEEMTFTGVNITKMASVLLESFNSGTIELYNDQDLIADLTRLSIVEKSFGWKLEASRTEHGHADRAIAMAIALPAAVELAGKKRKQFFVGTGGSTYEPEEEKPIDVGARWAQFVRDRRNY